MGDYENVPTSWGWRASASPSELADAVAADGGRLIAIHRPDGGEDEPYTGVWIVDRDGEAIGWDWVAQASASQLGDKGVRPR